MRKLLFGLLAALFFSLSASAQDEYFTEKMYVNADALNMRETPSAKGRRVCVLHAPARVSVWNKPLSKQYERFNATWAEVSYDFPTVGYSGFVLRKYLVAHPDSVTADGGPDEITSMGLPSSWVGDAPGLERAVMAENVRRGTAKRSTLTKTSSKASKAAYHASTQYQRGPRGGCYYLSASGKKVYVDRSYCNQ